MIHYLWAVYLSCVVIIYAHRTSSSINHERYRLYDSKFAFVFCFFFQCLQNFFLPLLKIIGFVFHSLRNLQGVPCSTPKMMLDLKMLNWKHQNSFLFSPFLIEHTKGRFLSIFLNVWVWRKSIHEDFVLHAAHYKLLLIIDGYNV